MATYKQIQDWVRANHGFVPKSCWIAHCKEMNNLPVKVSNRRYVVGIRQVPCPPDKRDAIENAFRKFGLLDGRLLR